MSTYASLDKQYTWHPFTQMRDWCAPDHEPIMLVEGQGALLRDEQGREYIDGNSSIWTNLHGHRHPRLDAALKRQIDRVAHTSFLGYSNPVAAQLAAELVGLWPADSLTRVFFSDDGSTAMEVALKMAVQYWQQVGQPDRRRFVAFSNAYHGDTMGASSLGGVPLFHERFSAWHFPSTHVATLQELAELNPNEIAAVCIEPIIQGVNQMRPWPKGMLRDLREWCDHTGVLLITDEVMTGFGRTGKMFACQQEDVVPDFIALAKGLTGGYMPLAATLTTEKVFEAFLGGPEKTLYYGHSYTGHQLGCAVALENLAIFREERVLEKLQEQIAQLSELFDRHLQPLPNVFDIRQCGFIAGIELRKADGEPFAPSDQIGTRVCVAAREFGLLTRPIRDTIVLMPPYCITPAQLEHAVRAIAQAVVQVCR